MQHKVILTITTLNGSQQYQLGTLAKYILIATIGLAIFSLFFSNAFLVKVNQDFDDLSDYHDQLSDQFNSVINEKALYEKNLQRRNIELDALDHTLMELQKDRDDLARKYKETSNKVLKKLNTLGYEVKDLNKYLDRKTLINKKNADKYMLKLLQDKNK